MKKTTNTVHECDVCGDDFLMEYQVAPSAVSIQLEDNECVAVTSELCYECAARVTRLMASIAEENERRGGGHETVSGGDE